MTDWLYDTFVYTGVLIAAVLLLRRPVSRHFGPQVAYALWALPLLRLLLPPIVLPASFAPAAPLPVDEPAMIYLTAAPEAAVIAPQEPIYAVGIELIDFLLPFWLGGAALFLIWRAREYLRMRSDLLAHARPVGEAGKVRLVETPAVESPIAFGVSDKVVALPPGFMSLHDITARDLAISHELAHHRGYDLVANIAAQPLLALHWFNPLAWWGWRAMRRDQEAACDARVVAGKQRSERAVYAQVIAGFAAGPHLALAAPMACPVLGEKSIIHRLRSLTMSDIPSGRKKLGIAAIVTTALAALPLTASISYAQNEAPDTPELPAAPALPAPVEAPAAPSIQTIDPDGAHSAVRMRLESDGEEAEERRIVIRRRAEEAAVRGSVARAEDEMERMFAELELELDQLDNVSSEVQIALEEGHRALIMAQRNMPRLQTNCEGNEVVQHFETDNGQKVMIICQRAVQSKAASALRQAQRAISATSDIPAEERERIVRELQDEIDQLEGPRTSAITSSRVRVQANLNFRTKQSAPPAPMAPPIRSSSARAQIWAPVFDEHAGLDACETDESGISA